LCLGISEKPNGVFLWVDLVVKELVTAIEDGLDDHMILDHLDTMPKGLSHLYGRIMANIPSNLIYYALNFFMMLQHKDGTGPRAVPKRLTLEELGICVHRSEVASVGDLKSESELLWLTNICGTTKMRLRSSCRGLIQAQQPNNSMPPIFKSLPTVKVGWVHLTVQEYASDNLEKLHARATEMDKVDRKRIPLVNSHRFYMVLMVRLLKTCAG
jgi:hypothetical protein